MAAVVLVGSALGLAHSCESGALGGRAIDGEQCHERAREPPVAHGAVGSLCVQVGDTVLVRNYAFYRFLSMRRWFNLLILDHHLLIAFCSPLPNLGNLCVAK